MARDYSIKEIETWDCCSYNPKWNRKFYFDALTEAWPLNKKIITNWPYSQNGLFLIKASTEAQRGCNILSLINCRSTESATANKIAAMIFRRQILGSLRFGDWKTINGDSYSILEFLQPEFYDELEIESFTENFLAEKPHLRELFKSPKKAVTRRANYDEDTIVQLIKQGWSGKQIRTRYTIGNTTLGRIRARHLEELKGFANPNSDQAHQARKEKRHQQYLDLKEAKIVSKAQKTSEAGS